MFGKLREVCHEKRIDYSVGRFGGGRAACAAVRIRNACPAVGYAAEHLYVSCDGRLCVSDYIYFDADPA